MREYESIYVLNPETTDLKAKEFALRMKDLILREGGKSIKLDCLGRRKLAWERKKYQRGIYMQHRYLGNPGLVTEYERTLAIEETVILRQSVLLNKNIDPAMCEEQPDQLEVPIIKEKERKDAQHRFADNTADNNKSNDKPYEEVYTDNNSIKEDIKEDNVEDRSLNING